MRFDQWRSETARIASWVHDVALDRVPKEYLWRLWRGDVSVWEAAQLCRNVVAAQKDQPDATDISRRAKRAL